ncbi:Rho GTPase-activating 6, partial [Brachionus plicatilis]
MYDNGKNIDMGEHFNTNDAACLLKEYLRSLPEPLLTRDLYSSFLATNKIANRALRLEMTRYIICLLPVPNRDTLEVLLKLLDRIKSHAEPVNQRDKIVGGNKMDAFNLAMVFGPNLLKKHKLSQISLNTKPNELQNDKYNIIDDIDSVISVTKFLIENQSLIFNIDSLLHNELIQTINNITPSEVELILNRKIASQI